MAVIATCTCGKSFNAKDELAGKRVKCPACGQPIQIPAGRSAVASPSTAAAPIAVVCQCGRSFNAPAQLAGKQVACPACQSPINIPQPAASDAFGAALEDPLGNLGDFASDPLMGGVPPQASMSPTYAPAGPGRARKAKPKFNSKIIVYIVVGIGGAIFLGCAGLFIFGFVAGVRQGINESRGVWKVHTSINGGYAAMLPGRVRTEKHRQQFGNFSAMFEEAVANAGNGDGIFITVFRGPEFATPQQPSWPQKSVDALRPEMPGATVSNVTVAGRPAIRVEGVLKIGDESSHKIGWYLLAGDRLYDISILSGDEPADPATVSKFIDSFRLIGVPSIRPGSASATP